MSQRYHFLGHISPARLRRLLRLVARGKIALLESPRGWHVWTVGGVR